MIFCAGNAIKTFGTIIRRKPEFQIIASARLSRKTATVTSGSARAATTATARAARARRPARKVTSFSEEYWEEVDGEPRMPPPFILEAFCQAEDPAVRAVRASIRPDNVGSLATIAGSGFKKVGEQWDPEDGLEFVFQRDSSTTRGR